MPDKSDMRLGAIILAGGRSKRMGRPKESLLFREDSLLGRTVATLRQCAEPVLVVARGTDQPLPPLPTAAHVVPDESPEAGPLAALAAGLRVLGRTFGFDGRAPVFACGCDAPFLTADVIRFLVDRLDAEQMVIPRAGGILQPLCAVYRQGVLAAADSLLAQGIRMPRSLATTVTARIVDEGELRTLDPELRFLFNVNSPDDYDRALSDPRP